MSTPAYDKLSAAIDKKLAQIAQLKGEAVAKDEALAASEAKVTELEAELEAAKAEVGTSDAELEALTEKLADPAPEAPPAA